MILQKIFFPSYEHTGNVTGKIILFFIITTVLLVHSCSRKYDMSEDYYVRETEQANDMDRTYSETEVRGNTGEEDDYEPGMGERDDKRLSNWDEEKKRDQNKQEDSGTKDETKAEMKVYFGYVRLLVNDSKESRSIISSLTDESGGYVEASYENTIIIRVPRELFTQILTTLMGMGEVLDKSIETYDVTEFYQDIASRLEISRKTRERLYNLLEKTTDVKERLKILKEIRRLSEEIENITVTLENIKRLISFSRITIKLEQRLGDISYEDRRSIPFPWIASLNPFYKRSPNLKGTVKMKTGDEFAIFDNKNYFFAESTHGVRIHITSRENSPGGDGLFWQKAVEYHLSRFYKQTEFLDLGNFKAVQFMSKDSDPFYYIVGVFILRDNIIVGEVLFPNQEVFEELGDRVKDYLKGCEIN